MTPKGGSPAWTYGWLAWIGVFFALEIPPILRGRPQDTLSDHVWLWFGIPQHIAPPPSMRARRFVLLTALAWVASHFLTGDEV